MSITGKSNATVSVTRMAGTTKKTRTAVGDFKVFITPLSDEQRADQYGGIGNTFEIFAETMELREGDRLADGDAMYTVLGVQQYKFGASPYSRIIAKSNNAGI